MADLNGIYTERVHRPLAPKPSYCLWALTDVFFIFKEKKPAHTSRERKKSHFAKWDSFNKILDKEFAKLLVRWTVTHQNDKEMTKWTGKICQC